LVDAIAMASRNPARAATLPNKGTIEPGADADLVILSPALEVEETFAGGKSIYRS
jgi:N-acetylglucosamine-6-phosphate deacetylase